jgi:hypothetical protein
MATGRRDYERDERVWFSQKRAISATGKMALALVWERRLHQLPGFEDQAKLKAFPFAEIADGTSFAVPS